MTKQCTYKDKDGISCNSFAFNLARDGIKQGKFCDKHYWQDRALKAEALAQPEQVEQEPVAYVVYPCTFFKGSSRNPELTFTKPELSSGDLIVNLCISPPKREWVGLTDNQIKHWWYGENGLDNCDMRKLDEFTQVVRAVEAKMKEKNNVEV
jgi:hypothetical protein